MIGFWHVTEKKLSNCTRIFDQPAPGRSSFPEGFNSFQGTALAFSWVAEFTLERPLIGSNSQIRVKDIIIGGLLVFSGQSVAH